MSNSPRYDRKYNSKFTRRIGDDVDIEVAAPLPLDVATTLINVIGYAYPDAVVKTDGKPGHITFKVPFDSRCRTKKKAEKIRQRMTYLDSEYEAQLKEFEPDGSMRLEAPKHMAMILAAGARAAFEDNPNALNYMEMTVLDKITDQTYVVTLARSKAQTPSALLTAAKDRIAELERRLTAAGEDAS